MFLIVLIGDRLPQQAEPDKAFWDGHNWHDVWSNAKLYDRREDADKERERIIAMFGNEYIARVEVRVIAGIEPVSLAERDIWEKRLGDVAVALARSIAVMEQVEFGLELEGKKHCPLCFMPEPNHTAECFLARTIKAAREAIAIFEEVTEH